MQRCTARWCSHQLYQHVHVDIITACDPLRIPTRRYTKMGYAGNHLPSYVIPTAVASDDKAVSGSRDKLEDLDFYIGDEVRVRVCRWASLRVNAGSAIGCLGSPARAV